MAWRTVQWWCTQLALAGPYTEQVRAQRATKGAHVHLLCGDPGGDPGGGGGGDPRSGEDSLAITFGADGYICAFKRFFLYCDRRQRVIGTLTLRVRTRAMAPEELHWAEHPTVHPPKEEVGGGGGSGGAVMTPTTAAAAALLIAFLACVAAVQY